MHQPARVGAFFVAAATAVAWDTIGHGYHRQPTTDRADTIPRTDEHPHGARASRYRAFAAAMCATYHRDTRTAYSVQRMARAAAVMIHTSRHHPTGHGWVA